MDKRGVKRPSVKLSVREDFLEEETTDQGTDVCVCVGGVRL